MDCTPSGSSTDFPLIKSLINYKMNIYRNHRRGYSCPKGFFIEEDICEEGGAIVGSIRSHRSRCAPFFSQSSVNFKDKETVVFICKYKRMLLLLNGEEEGVSVSFPLAYPFLTQGRYTLTTHGLYVEISLPPSCRFIPMGDSGSSLGNIVINGKKGKYVYYQKTGEQLVRHCFSKRLLEGVDQRLIAVLIGFISWVRIVTQPTSSS